MLRTGQPLQALILGIVSEGGRGEGTTLPTVPPGPSPSAHTWVMVTAYPQYADSGELLPASAHDKLRHVLHAVQHLLQLINQNLDLTQIESGQLRAALQPARLWPLLQECVAICGPLAHG